MDRNIVSLLSKELTSKIRGSWNVSYSLVFDDGTYLIRNENPCYSSLRSNEHYDWNEHRYKVIEKPISHIINKVMDHSIGGDRAAEIEAAYFYWLENESNYSFVFDKTIVPLLTERVNIVRTDVPSNLMMGALFATRMTSENGDKMEVWWDLVQHGVDPHVAILISLYTKKGEKVLTVGSPKNINHNPLDWHYGVVTSLVKNKPSRLDKNYRDLTSYNSVTQTWSGMSDNINQSLIGICLEDVKKVEQSSNNPFANANKSIVYRYEECIEAIADGFNKRIAVL